VYATQPAGGLQTGVIGGLVGVAVGGTKITSVVGVKVGTTGGALVWGGSGDGKGVLVGISVGVSGVNWDITGVGSTGWGPGGISCNASKRAAATVNATMAMAASPVKIGRQWDGPGLWPLVRRASGDPLAAIIV
jgi:hypothetical protein